MLDGPELDAPQGKEALVIEESPVERDENVKWEDVLQPRASLRGRNKKEQEREENKGEVDGVEGVAKGLAGEMGRAVRCGLRGSGASEVRV